MKYLLPVLLLLVAAHIVSAQDDETFRRLHGTIIRNSLYLQWDEDSKAFQYFVDEDNVLPRPIRNGMLFNAKNNHASSVGVQVKFYNPLKYVTDIKFKDVDDPSYQAVMQFIAKLPVSEAISESGAEGLKAEMLMKAAPARGMLLAAKRNPVAQVSNLQNFAGAIVLFQWIHDFLRDVDYSAILLDQDKVDMYNALVQTVNSNTGKIDDYLFKLIFIGGNIGESKGFNDWIKSRKDILFRCDDDLDEFQSRLDASEEVLNGLKDSRDAAQTSWRNLQQLLTSDYERKIKPLLPANKQADFGRHSASTIVSQNRELSRDMTQQEGVLDQYDQMISRLKKFTSPFKKNKKGYRLEQSSPFFDWKTKTMRDFVFQIKRLDIDGEVVEATEHECKFTIAKYQAIVPFISTGAFYTGFKYPNYAVSSEEGVSRVAEAGTTDVRIRPAVFLNMLFKTHSDWFYPFLQVGLSTGVSDFLIPVGGGLAISNKFSVSGGAMIGWRKDLTKLKVGDVVKDDAELKNDLSNRGAASWFFSINYNFIK